MAVYTEISDDELAQFVAAYDIGEVLSCNGIAEGVENSNFLLRTEKNDVPGNFILTLYEKRVNRDELPFFLQLKHHLNERGFSCPTPIARRDGQTLGVLANRPAAIISFLNGNWVRRPMPSHCAMLGKAMADMHLAGADFPMTRQNDLSVDGWRPLFEKSKDRADEVKPGLADYIDQELSFLEQNWPTNLPTGIIHADLFPDNVFFVGGANADGGRFSGFIDFYFACTDAFAYDLAICLNAWCFEVTNDFNITKARQMLSAYRAVRPFSEDELTALPILAQGAAMRFLLTRLYDWLNQVEGALVKPKDPLEYLKKLHFHSSVTSPAEYGLD